jgi:uncharacterized membrane protein YgdD (TMEM256/DUF423 family)
MIQSRACGSLMPCAAKVPIGGSMMMFGWLFLGVVALGGDRLATLVEKD